MELIAFPESATPSSLRIEANTKWNGRVLDLRFSLLDPNSSVKNLSLPQSATERRDELWKTTCFECFITTKSMKPSYYELNLSPAGNWAFYGFDSYRQGMKNPRLEGAPEASSGKEEKTWKYRIDFSQKEELLNETLLISLCAVIESTDGSLSYWSLTHRQPKPDFHHPEHFVHVLSPKE